MTCIQRKMGFTNKVNKIFICKSQSRTNTAVLICTANQKINWITIENQLAFWLKALMEEIDFFFWIIKTPERETSHLCPQNCLDMKCNVTVSKCIHPLIKLLQAETHNFVRKHQIKLQCSLSTGVLCVSLMIFIAGLLLWTESH